MVLKRKMKTRNLGLFVVVLACGLLAGLFLFLFYKLPGLGLGPVQPIAFSHRVHAGVKNIQCEFCHSYVSRSIHPGIPPVEKCLYCHNHIITRHPEIQKEHQYFNTKTPTPWVKANYLPEHVFFNHQRHIKKQVECANCHGDVAAMDRLSGTRFRMQFCIDCHTVKGANLDCWLGCHN
jgi:hypothetical protein